MSFVDFETQRKDKQLFCLAIEASPTAMVLVDQSQKIVFSNRPAVRLFKYSKTELLECTIDALISAEQYKQYEQSINTYFKNPHPHKIGIDADFSGLCKDRSPVPIGVELTPIPIDNSIYVLISFIDLTEKINSQKELEQQQLKALQASRMANIGEMAAGIAHEINNPLTVIKGKIQSIHNMMASGTLHINSLQQVIRNIDKTVNRISSIIFGLRTFSRDGRHDSYELVGVDNLIKDTFEFCHARLEQDHIQIRYHPIDRDIKVYCRAVQISQVILNLIQNARDEIVDKPEPWIEIDAYQDQHTVYITVTDSGHGLPAELREKIFTPFFTTKEVGKGTGLGLSLSRNIAKDHKGQLKIDNTCPNTRFVLELPRKVLN